MQKVQKFNFTGFIKNSNKAFRAAKKVKKRVTIDGDVILLTVYIYDKNKNKKIKILRP